MLLSPIVLVVRPVELAPDSSVGDGFNATVTLAPEKVVKGADLPEQIKVRQSLRLDGPARMFLRPTSGSSSFYLRLSIATAPPGPAARPDQATSRMFSRRIVWTEISLFQSESRSRSRRKPYFNLFSSEVE